MTDKKLKLCFSTLGCPEWGFSDIVTTACDLGCAGVEVRGIMREMFAPKIKIFSPEQIGRTKEALNAANLEIPILTTGAYLSDPSQLPLAEFEIISYAQLAQKLGVKYLRVMGEKTPAPSNEGNLDEIIGAYAHMCDIASRYGITLLLETNGILADSEKMKKAMQEVDRDNMGVLWDIHHPYRYFGESAEKTVENIGKYVKHVHIKDSFKDGETVKYVLTGYGDVPIKEAAKELNKIGYDGYYSYEWVKRWIPELDNSGIAFHSYTEFMKALLSE